LCEDVRFDLGGIAKGYAVDSAVEAMIAAGCEAGWVNAGGDLRAFGHARLPVSLRDEATGGVRVFATLSEGAFATSHFERDSRSQATGAPDGRAVRAHASVAAPLCMWADALTKLVAISGDASHPLLSRYGARAWLH
jgi:thiamine biosynthesis lipoprotein